MAEIRTDDLIAEGRSWGLPERRARAIVTETIDNLAACLEGVDLAEYAGVTPSALDTARARAASAASAAHDLLAGLTADDGTSIAPPPTPAPASPPTGNVPTRPRTPTRQPTNDPTRRRGPRH
jgi:hypothetical protein